ncbi:MAG: Glycosyl transferase family 2 [Candidatus Gottesmanbacteria bacterium GW2011_GWC2_39_8]|uniref:Glycosyl transferase family 2 n=1 Tax=Candidatus Gottesmanbacteria bacterium GW2011_GWC2_39_8 TaxID=1618450 RepID=A0A0G0SHZ4_9BACT|nr:MAG: Glycosyl transferase family 2 [Candidatus Gottesmanbacteria bacterium GW2011_GWC2_39_8]
MKFRIKSFEVVIPVYNEEKELEQSVVKLRNFCRKSLETYQFKITIADNASTDKTSDISKQLTMKYPEVNFLHLDQKGRGRAVKLAWIKSHADAMAYMDVDLSTDLKSFPRLLMALENDFSIAIGSRLLDQSKVKERTMKREFLSRVYNMLIRLFFGVRFHDAQCGFKAVNKKVVKELIPKIEDNEWFFDSELLIVGEKSGYKIYEEPVLWIDNPGSTVRVMKTAMGDLKGLWRLFWERPWEKNEK